MPCLNFSKDDMLGLLFLYYSNFVITELQKIHIQY